MSEDEKADNCKIKIPPTKHSALGAATLMDRKIFFMDQNDLLMFDPKGLGNWEKVWSIGSRHLAEKASLISVEPHKLWLLGGRMGNLSFMLTFDLKNRRISPKVKLFHIVIVA